MKKKRFIKKIDLKKKKKNHVVIVLTIFLNIFIVCSAFEMKKIRGMKLTSGACEIKCVIFILSLRGVLFTRSIKVMNISTSKLNLKGNLEKHAGRGIRVLTCIISTA